MSIASMFGLKSHIAARIKAEPGFHVLLVPTRDPTLQTLWVEVEEWGLCATKILSFDLMIGSTDSIGLIPLAAGAPIVSEGRVALGGFFGPGTTCDEAIRQMVKRGFMSNAPVKT